MANVSRGDLAYLVADLDAPVPDTIPGQLCAMDGVIMARAI